MKKKIAMLLTAAMVLGLVGCAQTETQAPAATEEAKTEETVELVITFIYALTGTGIDES